MGCCLLAALLIAGVRRAWFAVFPDRRPATATFAPAAARPAPGQVLVAAEPASSLPVRRVGLPMVAAMTVAAYALVTWLLDLLGAVATPHSIGRDVALAGVLAACVLVAVSSTPTPSRTSEVGVAMAVGGLAWTVLSLVDMHLLGGIEVTAASAAVELAVHGTGLALLSTGVALMRAPALVRRLEGTPA